MAAHAKPAKMTVEEFLAWAEAQPGDGKYELIDGVPVLKNGADDAPLDAMAPECFAHAEAKKTNFMNCLLMHSPCPDL